MRLIWLGLLTAHGTAAVAWWWLMPGGFPAGHPRFWVNEVLPVLVLAMVVVVRFGIWGRAGVRNSILATFPAFWLAVGVSGRVIFPESGRWFFLAPLALGVLTLGMVWAGRPRPARWVWGVVPFVAGLGVLLVWAERGRDADTRPAVVAGGPGDESAGLGAELRAPVDGRSIELAAGVKVDPADPVVTLTRGRMTLAVQPLLTFVSRSPDRCWTLFATREERDGPRRRLVGLERTGDALRLAHRDDTSSLMEVGMRDGAAEIDARTRLASRVYSHLNTFTELTISGHRKLEVSFSPCPERRIAFRPFSIGGDAPSRAAYLDADGAFRVVQARRAEKGPFATLAEGKMKREDALTMTFYDQDRAAFEVRLDDWASQAGVQASPTAGYGLPVNAIEFSLDGDSERSSAGMWVTLAATSVGRGWDSVGHGAGTYRNRVRVRVIGVAGSAESAK